MSLLPLPLMLALHGGGGTAQQFKDDNGMDAVSEKGGFLAVYPDGTGLLGDRLLTWNSGFNCCGYAQAKKIDDVGFLAAVIEDLAKRTPVDRRRIYVTGHSNGAMMAYRFAAERADLVVAVIPVSGAMAVNDFHPSRPVALLDIHSVDDPRALYNGGIGPPFPGTDNRVDHQPVMKGIEMWVANNGCDATPEVGPVTTGRGSNAGQTMTRLTWHHCQPGGDVVQLRFTGVGHGWPGAASRPLLQGVLGPRTTLINASEEAWSFASRYVR